MSGYSDFGNFYDLLNGDIDYSNLADFYENCFEKYSNKPEIILDLACGTGDLSIELSKRGYEVIGVDSSNEMLSSGIKKGENTEVLFLNQAGDELDLFGTVQGAICNLDSINHFEPEVLPQIIKKVALFLEKDCLFIFDVNTLYKFRDVLGSNTFVYDLPELYAVWENYFEDGVLDIHLDFFKKEGDFFTRFEDDFCEYYYSEEYLKTLLNECGFEIIKTTADFSFDEPRDTTQRIHYITRKRD